KASVLGCRPRLRARYGAHHGVSGRRRVVRPHPDRLDRGLFRRGSAVMGLRTPLGRVRGLGSAKEGSHHWWMQRVTAVALVPLTLWFVASLLCLAGADHAPAADWLASPLTAVLMLLLIVATFHHLQLGVQV